MKWEYMGDCIKITIPCSRKDTWQQSFLLTSDVHIDSKKCELKLFKKHLEQLKERNAYLIDNGDLYDCMGGKYDKRSNKADILSKLQVSNYFDALNDHAKEILDPVSDRIIMLSDGNHELSVTSRHEIDLIGRLQDSLNKNKKTNILRQGYTGWIKFVFNRPDGRDYGSMYMYRTHGNGGNAPVTKGVIQSARRQDIIDADIYVSGHIHTNYTVPRPMWKITDRGTVYIQEKVHHQLGTYKDSSNSTWENMKGFAPPSLGGSWMTFKYDSTSNKIYCEFSRAV